MCTIDIGIGHDNDLVITKLFNIEILTNTGTKCSNHGFNLCIFQNPVDSCFLYIQNLTTQWKDCLCCTGSGSLCRTTGGISLYDIDFTVLWIWIRTIGKLTGKRHVRLKCTLTGNISCFSGCHTGTLCDNCFSYDSLCHLRILL